MPEIHLDSFINAVIGGGAVWAAIRIEIKYLWRDHEKLEKRIEKLELKKAA